MTRSESRNTPFREASRNASKGGGAENGVEQRAEPHAIKGGPHARLAPVSRWSMFSLLSLLVVHSPVFGGPVLVLPVVQLSCCGAAVPVVSLGVRWRTRASETRTEGAALPAVWCEPARPGEERRRELSGHAGGPEPGASTLAVVGTGRHDSPTTGGGGGAGNLQGLVGPFGQPRLTL